MIASLSWGQALTLMFALIALLCYVYLAIERYVSRFTARRRQQMLRQLNRGGFRSMESRYYRSWR